jgi:uncharacterized protein YxeA
VELKGSRLMHAILGVVALLLVIGSFVIWECSEWIGARAELVREQARKLKLENDKREASQSSRDDLFVHDSSESEKHS